MKKISLIATSILIISLVLVGCRGNNGSGTNEEGTQRLKVGLVTAAGGINDGSFNEAANRGILQAEEQLNIQRLNPIESNQQEQYQPNLKTMASAADLTVGISFMMRESMEAISSQLPDKKFLLVDAVVDKANVVSYMFKEQEGAFLAGAMAGVITKTNKIGFVGGVQSSTIERFEAGFIAGVASVNPTAAKGLMPGSSSSHGQYVKYINDFSDQSKAKEAATILYNSGVDIIFHCAGGAGEGVFSAAKEKNTFAIGVDSDQASTLPNYKDVILFSVVKKVDTAVFEGIKDTLDGNFRGGETITLGIKEQGVAISETLSESVSQEAKDMEEKARNSVIQENITVPLSLSELLRFNAPALR